MFIHLAMLTHVIAISIRRVKEIAIEGRHQPPLDCPALQCLRCLRCVQDIGDVVAYMGQQCRGVCWLGANYFWEMYQYPWVKAKEFGVLFGVFSL